MPLRFNDGRPVPDELVGQTILGLRPHFHAISSETQAIRGHWEHPGQEFRDELVRLFVDVPDTTEHHAFFVRYKEELKARFQQLDVWTTTHPVEAL